MDHLNLIRKIAWSYSTSTQESFDDLFQEAYLVYLEQIKDYDPKRGKVTTHIWMMVHNRLTNYLRVQKRQTGHIEPMKEEVINIGYHTNTFFEQFTDDVLEVINIILSSPQLYDIRNPKAVKIRLFKVLRNQGWEKRKIKKSFQTLKLACN